ncbi:cas scaffolding protein family member 4-like isoform X1 [Leucoraja erinacea]|uniref:cas scaffolding protein family member 4-like isoform X1 n=1 Tax=Leucoraja erinaceus TaxID=7782 RepID=UPI00245654E6|nr:cas scaffolding protein family member 4-like isoform X1 [Leucoraja erinacea]
MQGLGGLTRTLPLRSIKQAGKKSSRTRGSHEMSLASRIKENAKAFYMYVKCKSVTGEKNLMAKALYDNKAETSDELAFRKGDILTVIERNIKGDEGWWRCSLHGRQGIVPGNRLQLISGSQYDMPSLYLSPCPTLRRPSQLDIYQMPTNQYPSSPLSSSSHLQDNIYQVPSRPQSYGQHYQAPGPSAEYCWDRGQAPTRQVFSLPRMGPAFSLNSISGPYADAYDIPPSHISRLQDNQMPNTAAVARKSSMFHTEEERKLIQQLYDIPPSFERHRAVTQSQVYDVPPRMSLDLPASVYDRPPAAGRELAAVRRPAWECPEERRPSSPAVYDVPVSREEVAARYSAPPPRPGSGQALYDVPVPQGAGLYHTPLSRARSAEIYDVPASLPKPPAAVAAAATAIYDLPRLPAGPQPVYDVPPLVSREAAQWPERRQSAPDTSQRPASYPAQATTQRPATDLSPAPSRSPATAQRPATSPTAPQSPDISPASAISQRLAPTPATPRRPAPSPASPPAGPGPEEMSLDAAAALDRLQQQVSVSVGSIMVFVSSRWRLREHLQPHLGEVSSAAGTVLTSLAAFLGLVRGVRVNAARLTDANLQSRLCKQLEVVEDSQQILVETSRALADCGWALDALVLTQTQTQAAPDHLDRFIMVTRTVPDDVKRLVSIIIANAKLLFAQKQPPQASPPTPGAAEIRARLQRKTTKHKAPVPTPLRKVQSVKASPHNRAEDCEYVQLQRKEEFENQEKEKESIRQREKESFRQKKLLLERQMSEVKIRRPGDVSVKVSPEVIQSPVPSSELCRMYFSALQKAIVSFTDTINGNQPAEVLIKHSKVVIMIGQKLVDTLCQETGHKNVHKEMLSKSNQFCGLMKKVAVATKNAVMQPSPTTVQEMKDQLAELRQQAEQLRLFLEKNTGS